MAAMKKKLSLPFRLC